MPNRYLISRLSSLGDVVCSIPAAGALKAAFPDCEVTWVVDRRFATIPRLCRHVDNVVEASPGLPPWTWPKVEGHFEAALDLQGLFKSGIVVAGASAKLKAAYHWQREGTWLFARGVRPDPTSLHIVDQYVDVARAVGGQAQQADFGLVPAPTDVKAVAEKITDRDQPFVVANPGAAWASKRWPAECFASVAKALASKGVQTVLIGGKAEADRSSAASVAELAPECICNLCGETTIGQLVALLSLAKAHVGGDTGSTHIAAALGIPAIGLYSITRPQRSCPYGQIDRCHYSPNGLDQIAPEAVASTVLESIQ